MRSVIQMFISVLYYLQTHQKECRDILAADDSLGYYYVGIDFLKLLEQYPDIGDSVLCNPVETLVTCDKDIVTAQQKLLDNEQVQSPAGPNKGVSAGVCERDEPLDGPCEENGQERTGWTVKRNVHARFYGLPVCPELHRTVFPKNKDVGCFLQVTGTVVRVTQSKMLEYRRRYICVKCKHETTVEASFEERYVLKAPALCSSCRSSNFTQVNLVSRDDCKDYQELKIQEQVNKLNMGSIPTSLWVTVEDDLVDCCKPGDDINVCGVLRRRWRPPTSGKKIEVELVLQGNHVRVCNAQRARTAAAAPDVVCCFREYWSRFRSCPLKGRDAILAAVCPQVYGLYLVKLALLMTVITGSSHVDAEEDRSRTGSEEQHKRSVRGQCHLLLVGDPGTGKSQLLRAGAELVPRSVLTSGSGSTRAGLTCAALREEGEWQLEAGALVLADGGVCCVDELGRLREHDRTSIHEAMEQQTISIAKAGIVCKLSTRCAVIGACNPRGHYRPDQPLSSNVALGTPLLSRFDLIFILLDTKNEEWDRLVTSYILFGNNSSSVPASSKLWSVDKLQMYLGVVGARRTEMSPSARAVLHAYYTLQRGSQLRDPARTTVRMLDSLVRLSQAHCRLMFREVVSVTDAVTAVSLVDLSMRDCTLRGTEDALHSSFPAHPDLNYLRTARPLLSRLNLHRVWTEELHYYSRLLSVDGSTLESELDSGSSRLFATFDDLVDDNVPLSCSLVTSSYFHKGEKQQEENNSYEQFNAVDKADEKIEDNNLNLADTLQKHSSVDKVVNEPIPKVQRNILGQKRKRKEVILLNGLMRERKESKNMYSSKKQSKQRKSLMVDTDSSEELIDHLRLLNHVPSVNDVFVDLDIHMSFENDDLIDKGYENTSESRQAEPLLQRLAFKRSTETVIENKTKYTNISNITEHAGKDAKSTCSSSVITEPNCSFRESKLKQFKFNQKHDLTKFYEQTTKPRVTNSTTSESVDIVELLDKKSNSIATLSNRSNSGTSSQISMFESLDCEVDLVL